MSNVMLLSPLNDDGSNSLTSTPSVAMETDQSVYDLQKDMQQRSAGESNQSIYFHLTEKYSQNIHRLFWVLFQLLLPAQLQIMLVAVKK